MHIPADVTVVVPTCDRGAMLRVAVDSVLAQTVPAKKVIVVDNGISPVVDSWQDDRVEVIRTLSLIGPSRARNIGARLCTTKYVAFLDDDDFWLPEYLEETFKVIMANSTARVVVGALYRSAKKGKIKRYKTFPHNPNAQRAVYYRNPGFGGQNVTIDSGVFVQVGGFDECLPASVDRDLGARLLQSGFRIFVAPAAIAVLCHHERPRVRGHQVRGNRLFLAKHWRHMRWGERYKATRTLIQRLWRYQVVGRTPD